MKTTKDLSTIFENIVKLISEEDHEIGATYFAREEDGIGQVEEYEENIFVFDEDGWLVEVKYRCSGEWYDDEYYGSVLRTAWGEVVDIYASYEDEETEDFIEFAEEDLKELREMINKELRYIA